MCLYGKYCFVILFLLALILGGCAPSQWKTQIDWDDLPPDILNTPENYPDHGAIVLRDESSLNVFRGDISFSEMKRRRVIKVLDQRGFKHANITLPYSGNTSINDIQARTITPDKKIILLDEDDIFDVNLYPGFIFYTDVRAKRFTFPGIEKGCIIEYNWTATTKGHSYWTNWQIQHSIPTLLSRFKVLLPSDWGLKWRTISIEAEPKTVDIPDGFNQEYVWEFKNVPALVTENGMPPLNDIRQSLLLSPFGINTWQDVAFWYHNLIKDRIRPTKQIRLKALDLTSDCTTEIDKLERLFTFVRDQIRYVAISIGVGGYQPHPAEDVLHNRYGDCKDKTALLISLAKAVDIQVDPVIISTWYNGDVDTSMATHTIFNHVIASATLEDSLEIWMDTTSLFTQFKELPWYDQNRQVFVITASGEGIWKTTPSTTCDRNQRMRYLSMEMDSLENFDCSLTFKYTGAQALEIRKHLADADRDKVHTWLTSQVVKRFPKAYGYQFEYSSIRELDSLYFKCRFKWNPRPEDMQNLILPLDRFFSHSWYDLFIYEKRKHPIEFRFASSSIDSLYIRTLGNFSIFSNFKNHLLTESYIHSKSSCFQKKSNEYALSMRFTLPEVEIPSQKYHKAGRIYNSLRDRYFQSLIIKKN